MDFNGSDSNNNNGPESLVQEWGRILVRTLVPNLVPENQHPECHNYECQYPVADKEIVKKKVLRRKEADEVFEKVTIGRQYLTKELIPVAGGSLTHPTIARSNKIFAAAIKIAEKISKEDIERLTSGKNDDYFMVSVNKVVATNHTYWNDNITKIVVLVPVLKLPIRLPYVITHNGRYFTMKLDEINLERFCQERSDNIALV